MAVIRTADYIDSAATRHGVSAIRGRTMEEINDAGQIAKAYPFVDTQVTRHGVPTLRMRSPDGSTTPKTLIHRAYIDAFGVQRWRTAQGCEPIVCGGFGFPCAIQITYPCTIPTDQGIACLTRRTHTGSGIVSIDPAVVIVKEFGRCTPASSTVNVWYWADSSTRQQDTSLRIVVDQARRRFSVEHTGIVALVVDVPGGGFQTYLVRFKVEDVPLVGNEVSVDGLRLPSHVQLWGDWVVGDEAIVREHGGPADAAFINGSQRDKPYYFIGAPFTHGSSQHDCVDCD